jgi:glycosyltransferase involved in cell wall biosynthesis
MKSPFEQILFIGPHYINHRGGIGAVLEIYSRHIAPFNFIATFSYRKKYFELFFYIGALLKVSYKLLTNRKIKVVHIHGAKDGSVVRKVMVCFIAKKIFFRKVVYHIHSGAYEDRYNRRNGLYRALVRFIIRNSEAIIVLSPKWFDFFNSNFKIKKMLVIRNPVEESISEVAAAHVNGKVNGSVNGNGTGVFKFLFLGKIVDHKGIFDLVNLFGDEQDYLRGKCKLYAGGNHEVDKLLQMIEEKKISDIVEYIGWTQGQEKANYFKECDCFILPTYVEAMPMTMLEAFSYGKPVITTPVGSIPEILEHNYNGLLFEPGNMPDLKKLITQVISDRCQTQKMGKNAFQKISEFYPSAIKTELEKLYATI